MADVAEIPYSQILARRGACFHAGRSLAQADLYEIEWEGQPALLKDFSGRPWLVRRTWGRAIVAREVRALRRLAGVAGIPRLYAVAGSEAFIMERLEAQRMPQRGEAPPPPVFWQNARRLVDELHARGIGHGDLRRKNILVGPAGEAYVIDFATSFFRGSTAGLRGWLSEAIFRRYERVDRITYARIKSTYGEAVELTEDERRWLAEQPWYLKAGRFWKKNVYQLRKARWWRDRWHKVSRWVRHKIYGPPPA